MREAVGLLEIQGEARRCKAGRVRGGRMGTGRDRDRAVNDVWSEAVAGREDAVGDYE